MTDSELDLLRILAVSKADHGGTIDARIVLAAIDRFRDQLAIYQPLRSVIGDLDWGAIRAGRPMDDRCENQVIEAMAKVRAALKATP